MHRIWEWGKNKPGMEGPAETEMGPQMLTVSGGKPCPTNLGNWMVRFDAVVDEGRRCGLHSGQTWPFFEGQIYESGRSAAQMSAVRLYSASSPRMSTEISAPIPGALLATYRPEPRSKWPQSTSCIEAHLLGRTIAPHRPAGRDSEGYSRRHAGKEPKSA